MRSGKEFQDVRDLVINNRLSEALRQAKNLIDYLENEVGKQDEDNGGLEEGRRGACLRGKVE